MSSNDVNAQWEALAGRGGRPCVHRNCSEGAEGRAKLLPLMNLRFRSEDLVRPEQCVSIKSPSLRGSVKFLEMRLLNAAYDRDFLIDLWIGHRPQFGMHGFTVDMVNEANRRKRFETVQTAMEVEVRALYTGTCKEGCRFDAAIYFEELS